MFNITIYKLFNDDLKKLNNNQLLSHWKVVGHKENRIYSLESFFKKYNDFVNIETLQNDIGKSICSIFERKKNDAIDVAKIVMQNDDVKFIEY